MQCLNQVYTEHCCCAKTTFSGFMCIRTVVFMIRQQGFVACREQTPAIQHHFTLLNLKTNGKHVPFEFKQIKKQGVVVHDGWHLEYLVSQSRKTGEGNRRTLTLSLFKNLNLAFEPWIIRWLCVFLRRVSRFFHTHIYINIWLPDFTLCRVVYLFLQRRYQLLLSCFPWNGRYILICVKPANKFSYAKWCTNNYKSNLHFFMFFLN